MSDLCSQLRACLIGRGDKDVGFVTKVDTCDSRAPEQAPMGSGVRSTAFVSMSGEVNEYPMEGWYLVAEYPTGFCLIDQILVPSQKRSTFETDFETAWSREVSPFRFRVQSHRVTYIELDEAEADEGVSNVGYEECEQVEYEVKRGVFSQANELGKKGPCGSPAPIRTTGAAASAPPTYSST
jgi:hypothetical protein